MKISQGAPCGQAQFEFVHDHGCQIREERNIITGRGARYGVKNAEGTEVERVMGTQRNPQIELNAAVARDERVGERADIRFGVADEPGVFLQNARGTEAKVTVDLVDIDSMLAI